jgi:hypothetical protein
MTLDLTHLSAAARLQAFESSDARVRLVQEARWISHERVQRVLDELEWRYLHPVCQPISQSIQRTEIHVREFFAAS